MENTFRQIIDETRKAKGQESVQSQPEECRVVTSAGLPSVAFQGERGAFSDQAAQRLFPQGAGPRCPGANPAAWRLLLRKQQVSTDFYKYQHLWSRTRFSRLWNSVESR